LAVWLTSDTHFSHKHIAEYAGRPWADLNSMDTALIDGINSFVKQDDILWHLGDVSFLNKEKTAKLLTRIKCKNKKLIMGNHDRSSSAKKFLDIGFTFVSEWPVIIDKFFILSHEPMFLEKNSVYHNIHGHIHQYKYDDVNHYTNVCPEVNDYFPVALTDIVQRLKAEFGGEEE
jgi:calcineurin-like phosphoesterase family protein